MGSLGDDELLSIFDKIHNVHDRTSFYQVSKQFLRVACTGMRKMEISYPDLLKDILTISPHMVKFTCYKPLPNAYMELLARSCPNLQHLGLYCFGKSDFDFDDDGLCVVAKACSHLKKVELNGRHVGDVGVDFLVRSCKDLISLELNRCAKVTDESLKYIKELKSLRDLHLDGCLITDMGLKYLTKGDLKNSLMLLSLNGCDKISDIGICHLKQMVNLTHLSFSRCGANITDYGIAALSQIPNIMALNLSRLNNVTDISLSQIASNCKKLWFIELTGCEAITGKGVRCFAHHPALRILHMSACYNNIFWDDVESVASTCRRLISIWLSRRIKTPMPKEDEQELFFQGRELEIRWFM